MSGNFKARCVDTNGARCYTIGNVYDITDGTIISDYGDSLFTGKIKSFDDLEKYSVADWELVEENTKNLSLTITSEKATISDGEDTLEIDRDCYKNERDVMSKLLDIYYDEKNKIKVGDSVSITNTICYRYHKEFIVDNAQELIDRMGLVEFSNLLLKFNSRNIPFLNGKYKVHLMAKHTNINKELVIISDDNNTFIINIDNLKKIYK